MTTEKLAELAVKTVKKMSGDEKAKLRSRMRREYGPSYFSEKISGLAAAARQLAKEEQLILNFDPKGKAVN